MGRDQYSARERRTNSSSEMIPNCPDRIHIAKAMIAIAEVATTSIHSH